MSFLKKHYEKILLGLVLAGLVGVLVFMLFYIAADKRAMEDLAETIINPSAKPLTNIDLTVSEAALARVQSPFRLDFETGNKLFNPFEWQKTPDGRLIKKATSTGPQIVVVTNIAPLYLILSLDSVTTNELGARYVVSVEHQGATNVARRHRTTHYVSVGDKNDTFALSSIQGPPENPDALILKLTDTGEPATVTRSLPYRRVDGYLADFRYDPEKRVFRGRRVGDRVSFGGADYLVVEINQHELILADQSNQKKTSLPFAP